MRYVFFILTSPVAAVVLGKIWSGDYYRHLGRDVLFGLVFGVMLSIIVAVSRSRSAERERQRLSDL